MNPIIRCIILDDEPLAVNLLKSYSTKLDFIEIIYAGCDVYEAIRIANREPLDLIFMDIQMPDLTGIEVMKLLNKNHNFIITSAYQEFALDVYKFHVIDFLLKPITFSRFSEAIQKYIDWQNTFPLHPSKDYILLKSNGSLYKIKWNEMDYIEGMKDYIRIHSSFQTNLMVLETMKNMMIQLPKQFIRVHKSYIINKDKIKCIDSHQIILCSGIKIPIGKTYKEQLKKIL